MLPTLLPAPGITGNVQVQGITASITAVQGPPNGPVRTSTLALPDGVKTAFPAALANRVSMIVINIGAGNCWIGPSTVAVNDGIPLVASIGNVPIGSGPAQAWYGLADGHDTTLVIVEMASS